MQSKAIYNLACGEEKIEMEAVFGPFNKLKLKVARPNTRTKRKGAKKGNKSAGLPIKA
jgi:hypothetical protein